MESTIKDVIRQRKKDVTQDDEIVKALNIPLIKYDEIPDSLTIPLERKKIEIKETIIQKDDTHESMISLRDYESILEILSNMSIGMQRNPYTFNKLQEEEIRNIFLIILNSHFEGKATGETFNQCGKTDILVRHQNQNIFIAECKIWKGRSEFKKSIEQLFNYITWNDTKTALLLFIKKKKPSLILDRIQEVAQSHSKKQISFNNVRLKGETTFGYIFAHPRDEKKDVYVTIMGFIIQSTN
jgi:hypothetical protein